MNPKKYRCWAPKIVPEISSGLALLESIFPPNPGWMSHAKKGPNFPIPMQSACRFWETWDCFCHCNLWKLPLAKKPKLLSFHLVLIHRVRRLPCKQACLVGKSPILRSVSPCKNSIDRGFPRKLWLILKVHTCKYHTHNTWDDHPVSIPATSKPAMWKAA